MKIQWYILITVFSILYGQSCTVPSQDKQNVDLPIVDSWIIESQQDWQDNMARQSNLDITEGKLVPTTTEATFQSTIKKFTKKRLAKSITFSQSPEWLNGKPVPNIGPSNLGDAPIALQLGDGNYWMFGRNIKSKSQKNGTFNDQDPHLYIDEDLTDGVPGENMGMAFNDPSHGSDCPVIRDLEGNFHIIAEDWTPIDASTHAWDSPLAVRAVSAEGINDFEILNPPVDERTTPTGRFAEYVHPHWHAEAPERFPGRTATVDVPQHRIKAGDIREGYGFQFEVKVIDTTENESKPIIDKVVVRFEQ